MRRFWPILLFISGPVMALCPGYTYERTLTINASQVSTGTLTYTNIPVLFTYTDVTLSTASSGGHLSTVYDIIFSTNSNGFPLVNWDTETFNNTGSAQGNVFIKVPSISSATNTTLYMCYGNSSTTSYQGGNSSNTWNNGYAAVYHLGTTTGSIINSVDSSGNGNLGITGSTAAPSAQIDGGASFVASSSNFITGSGNSKLTSLPTVPFTMTGWYLLNSTGAANAIYSDNNGTYDAHLIWITGGFLYNTIFGADCVTFHSFNYTGPGNALSKVWHFFSVSTSGSLASPTLNVSLDGNAPQVFTPPSLCTNNPPTGPYIGKQALNSGYFDGFMDEIEISTDTKSSDWIKTEYNNQSSPSTFITLGSENLVAAISPKLFSVQGGVMTIRGGELVVQ